MALGCVATVAGFAGYLLLNPDWRLNDSGLRILWQLVQGGGAALLLLAGCWLAFKKRAGVVLLHGGVGLLMLSELHTGLTAVETRMQIDEGSLGTFAYNTREFELAFVDSSPSEIDRVTVIPESLLIEASEKGEPISHPDLPVDVRVVRYLRDSSLATPESENLATAGAGLGVAARSTEDDAQEKRSDRVPSAYIELLDKTTGESRGVFLVSVFGDVWSELVPDAPFLDQVRSGLGRQSVSAEEGGYSFALRMERTYKQYSLELKDFSFKRYAGTDMAKDYRSIVQLRDPTNKVDREVPIYMNNPLRYSGDTLYQADFDKADEKTTVLQVVANEGWMAPYVACMLVSVGMLAHFGVTLGRLLKRGAGRTRSESAGVGDDPVLPRLGEPRSPRPRRVPSWTAPAVWFPVLMVVLWGGYAISKARPPNDSARDMQITKLGAVPVVQGGRVKPFDTLARTTLQALSNRQEVILDKPKLKDDAGLIGWLIHESKKAPRVPAARWLIGAIAGDKRTNDFPVFRVENLELLDVLGLERRPGSYRYSLTELAACNDELNKQIRLAEQVEREDRTLFQNKVIELATRRSVYSLVLQSFSSPRFSADRSQFEEDFQVARMELARLRSPNVVSRVPHVVPPSDPAGEWRSLYEAELFDLIARATGREADPATHAWGDAAAAFAGGDVSAFNEAVSLIEEVAAQHEADLNRRENAEVLAALQPAERPLADRQRFEQRFNYFAPLYYASVLYVAAFLLAGLGLLVWRRPLSRGASAVIFTALALHTWAIVGGVYISGRPPVTNLYSSAVFIGWSAALFAVSMETIYRIGVGNIMASVIGFLTLLVAYFLSLDGDTFEVLQAVLDTQFWLATHVVCITLGYATTLLAGFLAAGRLIAGHVVGSATRDQSRDMDRMIYGALCFATLFSFVGTVLGGLWADDSWGRFWGWDPKENGALLIVLWNALVLHCRWGKLTGPIGLAALAVLGNVVVAWSWFGTNELGEGLHTYGFTEGRAQWLMIFASSQLVIATTALLPSGSALQSHREATS